MVRERWDEWREGERRSAGGSEGRGEDDHSSLRRNLGWCGDRGRDCMDARRRRSGWGAAGRLPGTLFLQLVVLLLSAHAIQGMDVTVSATGTDDALLSSGATPFAIVEGEDTCADSSHCYISADAIQAAFASGNVTLSVTGAIHWSGAPTDGNPLSSSSSATLTLSCGDASVPTDGLRVTALLQVPNGAVFVYNSANDGKFCLVGSNAASGGSDAACSLVGLNGCSGNGLVCLLGAELQLITAASLILGNSAAATGTQVVVNGLSAADAAAISGTLSLWPLAATFSGTAQQQVIFSGFASSVSCALDVRAYSGVTLSVAVASSGGSNGGDIYIDGDADAATAGGIVLSAPASGNMIAAGGMLTLGATTDKISYGGTGNLLLAANGGISLLSSATPSATNREVTLNADADGTGAGTLTLAAGVIVGSASNTRTVTITAADLVVGSTTARIYSSGAYNMFLYSTNGKPIGIGVDVSAQGGMSVSAAEAQVFAGSRLCVGDAMHGGIYVGPLTATNTDNVQTWCFLASGTSGAGGTVTFQTGASQFRVLEVTAVLGIYLDVPGTNGVTTTYFTGTLTLEITGTAAQGAAGIVFRDAQYLNAATKLTLTSEVGIVGDATLYLNAGAGVTIDGDVRMNSTSSDLNLLINADTDVGGQGQFVLCADTAVADSLAGGSVLCTGIDRSISAIAAAGYTSTIKITSTKVALAGYVDGGTGTVQLAPSQAQAIAVGDEKLIAYTITQDELNRISTSGTLVVGSDAVIIINLAGLNHTRTGLTEMRCRSASCYIMVYVTVDPVTSALGRNVTFAGPLSLVASDGVFVTTASLDVGGDLTIDANYDSAGASVFFCPDGNKKASCTSDSDCSRNLCGDGVTFCDNGQSDCSATVCLVPLSPGKCLSQGHLAVNTVVTLHAGNLDITADHLTINSTDDSARIVLTTNGLVSVQPKTRRAMRLGLASGLSAYALNTVAGKEMEIAQETLDRIETTNRLTIGGSRATTVWMRAVERQTLGGLYIVATYDSASKINLNGTGCASDASCAVSTLGPLSLLTTGTCNLLVAITVEFLLGNCAGGTFQTGALTITGVGSTLSYSAVGDLVILGDIINQDPMILSATGHVSITSSLTSRGQMTIVADSDGDGAGSFTLGENNTLTTNGFNISVTAFDAEILGTFDALHNHIHFYTSFPSGVIGVNVDVGASGMTLSAPELRRLVGRHLTVGGASAGLVRASGLTLDMLPRMDGVVLLRALAPLGAILLNFEDPFSQVRALDAEALQNVTLSGNLTSTTGVVILRAGRSSQAGVVVIAEGVTATAHTDLEVDAGERGQVNLTAPVALLAARHLKIQSDVWVTGTGVTQLSADADGNNDGTASLKLGRLITLPRNVTNGTLLLTADNLGFGARSVDMDVGALLVTASSWNLQSDCSTRSHLDVQSYNAAPDKFRRGAGPAFFEPVRTQVSSVRRSDGLLIYSSSSPASPAAASALSTRIQTRLNVEGTVISADASPSLSASFSRSSSSSSSSSSSLPLQCAPTSLTFAPATLYLWPLLNGSTISRASSPFSLSCAVAPSTGSAFALRVRTTPCGGSFELLGAAGHPPPKVHRIEPKSASAAGGETLTILGDNFGSVCACLPPPCSCAANSVSAWLEGATSAPLGGAAQTVPSLSGGAGVGEGEARACREVKWTSDSSITCTTPALSLPFAQAVVEVSGQRARGGEVQVGGAAAWVVACAGAVSGRACPSGHCRADCDECCRRSCQAQWEEGDGEGSELAERASGVVGGDSYASCAVLCAAFCAPAP